MSYTYVGDDASLAAALARLAPGPLALDVETANDEQHGLYGLDPRRTQLITVQLCDGETALVIDARRVNLENLRPILTDADRIKVIHNAVFELKMFAHLAHINVQPIFCTMLAELVLRAGLDVEAGLADLARQYLHVELPKEVRTTFGGELTLEQMEYAARDVQVLLPIYREQRATAMKEKLADTLLLELQVAPVVAAMELAGCLVDVERWRAYLTSVEERLVGLRQTVRRQLLPAPYCECFPDRLDTIVAEDGLLNLESPQLLLWLLRRRGMPLSATNVHELKGYMYALEAKDETVPTLLPDLLEYRKHQQIKKAFGESVLSKVHPLTGRLHPEFRQLGARTGRFSARSPNLQQIPKRDPQARELRRCFIAAAHRALVTADFSQIELRVLAQYSKDAVMRKAFNSGQDLHKATAALMWNIAVESVTPEQRAIAKNLAFGTIYGLGPRRLSTTLKIPVEEAKAKLDRFFQTYPTVKRWLNSAANDAVERGRVYTLLGRRRLIPAPDPDDPDYESLRSAVQRMGKNTPIQGTAADIVKMALVAIHQELTEGDYDAALINTVHDEIVVEAAEEEAAAVAKLVERCMVASGRKLLPDVPVEVDVKVGPAWGEAYPVAGQATPA